MRAGVFDVTTIFVTRVVGLIACLFCFGGCYYPYYEQIAIGAGVGANVGEHRSYYNEWVHGESHPPSLYDRIVKESANEQEDYPRILAQKTGMSLESAKRYHELIRVDSLPGFDLLSAKTLQLKQTLGLSSSESQFLIISMNQNNSFEPKNSEAQLSAIANKIDNYVEFDNLDVTEGLLIYTIRFVRANFTAQTYFDGGNA